MHRGQGAQAALGRAAVQLEPVRRQPAAGAAVAHGQPRRRSTFPVAVAADLLGEKVGEDEGVVGKLTVLPIWWRRAGFRPA